VKNSVVCAITNMRRNFVLILVLVHTRHFRRGGRIMNSPLPFRQIIVCAAIASSMFATRAIADSCANQHLDGQYKGADYSFEYQSWLGMRSPNETNSNQDYQFGALVRNRKPTALWVDWKEMGMSGFVPFDQPRGFVTGDPTGECEVVDADLWYGDAPVLLPRVSAIHPLAKGFAAQIVHVVSEKVLDAFKKWGKVFTVSRSNLYVPIDEHAPPEKFVQVEVMVSSEAAEENYKLSLEIHRVDGSKGPQFSGGTDGVLFSAIITDPFMAHGLQSDHVSYMKSEYDGDKVPFASKVVQLRAPPTEVYYRITHLRFEDAQHRRIGSMPVAIFEPNAKEREGR
jgi:hypothetical protein